MPTLIEEEFARIEAVVLAEHVAFDAFGAFGERDGSSMIWSKPGNDLRGSRIGVQSKDESGSLDNHFGEAISVKTKALR